MRELISLVSETGLCVTRFCLSYHSFSFGKQCECEELDYSRSTVVVDEVCNVKFKYKLMSCVLYCNMKNDCTIFCKHSLHWKNSVGRNHTFTSGEPLFVVRQSILHARVQGQL